MITDEEKAKIREEEIFRDEVRKSIGDGTFKWSKILNAPFTIFFLSSIVLGLLSWSYTKWETTRDNASASREQVLSLETEIAFRLSHIQALSEPWNGEKRLLLAYRATCGLSTEWLLPKHKEHTLIALAWQLERAVDPKLRSNYTTFRKTTTEWWDLMKTIGSTQHTDISMVNEPKRTELLEIATRLKLP